MDQRQGKHRPDCKPFLWDNKKCCFSMHELRLLEEREIIVRPMPVREVYQAWDLASSELAGATAPDFNCVLLAYRLGAPGRAASPLDRSWACPLGKAS